jgi:type 1 glutamine amidotransferase
MMNRHHVHLIVAAEYHDADYVRRELLSLLGEEPLIAVSCHSDWHNASRLGAADFLVTYTSNVFPDAAQLADLEAFLEGGGRWLAIHGSAAYTEFRPPAVNIGGIELPGLTDTPDRQPDYMRVLGCRFVSHLAMQDITITPVSEHPIVAGIPPFVVLDEPYILELRGKCEVLATSRFTGEAPGYVQGPWLKDDPRPQIVLSRHGDGEVLYIAPGHTCGPFDLRPFIDEIPAVRGPWPVAAYREIIAGAIRWGTGQTVISTSSSETVTG